MSGAVGFGGAGFMPDRLRIHCELGVERHLGVVLQMLGDLGGEGFTKLLTLLFTHTKNIVHFLEGRGVFPSHLP